MTSVQGEELAYTFLDVMENKHVSPDGTPKASNRTILEKERREVAAGLARLKSLNLVHFGLFLFYSLSCVVCWHFHLFMDTDWPWFIPAIGFFLLVWCCYYWVRVLSLYKGKSVQPKKTTYFYFHKHLFLIVTASLILGGLSDITSFFQRSTSDNVPGPWTPDHHGLIATSAFHALVFIPFGIFAALLAVHYCYVFAPSGWNWLTMQMCVYSIMTTTEFLYYYTAVLDDTVKIPAWMYMGIVCTGLVVFQFVGCLLWRAVRSYLPKELRERTRLFSVVSESSSTTSTDMFADDDLIPSSFTSDTSAGGTLFGTILKGVTINDHHNDHDSNAEGSDYDSSSEEEDDQDASGEEDNSEEEENLVETVATVPVPDEEAANSKQNYYVGNDNGGGAGIGYVKSQHDVLNQLAMRDMTAVERSYLLKLAKTQTRNHSYPQTKQQRRQQVQVTLLQMLQEQEEKYQEEEELRAAKKKKRHQRQLKHLSPKQQLQQQQQQLQLQLQLQQQKEKEVQQKKQKQEKGQQEDQREEKQQKRQQRNQTQQQQHKRAQHKRRYSLLDGIYESYGALDVNLDIPSEPATTTTAAATTLTPTAPHSTPTATPKSTPPSTPPAPYRSARRMGPVTTKPALPSSEATNTTTTTTSGDGPDGTVVILTKKKPAKTSSAGSRVTSPRTTTATSSPTTKQFTTPTTSPAATPRITTTSPTTTTTTTSSSSPPDAISASPSLYCIRTPSLSCKCCNSPIVICTNEPGFANYQPKSSTLSSGVLNKNKNTNYSNGNGNGNNDCATGGEVYINVGEEVEESLEEKDEIVVYL